MVTHSSSLVWKIPWTEEPGGLQFMGLQESDTMKRLSIHAYHHRQGDTSQIPGDQAAAAHGARAQSSRLFQEVLLGTGSTPFSPSPTPGPHSPRADRAPHSPEHLTPASSSCLQSLCPQGSAAQSHREDSRPPHRTSSSQMLPFPGPNAAARTASRAGPQPSC